MHNKSSKRNDKKRILIFSGYFFPHVGGFEKNVQELSVRLCERGYEVDILTDNSNCVSSFEQIGKIRIFRLPCWNILGGTYPVPRPSLSGFKIFIKLLRNDYQIVNTQTRFFIISFYGLLFARLKKIPLIHTERGSRHSIVTNKLVDILSRMYDHTLGTILVKSAKVNIGISESVCRFLKHIGARNIELIPNGINTDEWIKRISKVRESLGIGDNEIVITFVGRLIYGKGVQDLISVFPDIQNSYKNIKLLIVGDGTYRSKLELKVFELGCHNSIFFLGQRDKNEVIDILSISDIFVNPSYSEGLPSSVMEAASIGLPIIATDVGGTKEIIINSKTGILIEPEDKNNLEIKMCELIYDSKMRNRLGINARKHVTQSFDWNQITNKMIDLLNGLNGVAQHK
jgi:glycosyltransferase involved in cell wall biosynthesis